MKVVTLQQETDSIPNRYRLTAENGMLLTNGLDFITEVVTYDPSVWYEIPDPGDDRYIRATVEDYVEKLKELGVEV